MVGGLLGHDIGDHAGPKHPFSLLNYAHCPLSHQLQVCAQSSVLYGHMGRTCQFGVYLFSQLFDCQVVQNPVRFRQKIRKNDAGLAKNSQKFTGWCHYLSTFDW